MFGRRELTVAILASLVLTASIVGVFQVAEVRRLQDASAIILTEQTPGDWDGDGIPDAIDACPARPERFNGFQDQDGCPDIVTTTRAS